MSRKLVSTKLEFSASCSMGMPRYRRTPFSPSRKVMALFVEAVFAKPLSSVTSPVSLRRSWMLMARSPSVPVTTGSVMERSSIRSAASSVMLAS